MITRIFGTVTGGRLNLRAAANSSASILASIPNETLLVVTEHNATWYAATYGSHTGFVMKQYITLLNLANATELPGEVTGGSLNMRRTASTSADCLIQIPNSTAITVIDFDADSQWYITDHNGYTGYVMKQYVTVSQPVPNWAYGQVNVAELNIRREPSTSAGRLNNVWPRKRSWVPICCNCYFPHLPKQLMSSWILAFAFLKAGSSTSICTFVAAIRWSISAGSCCMSSWARELTEAST